jgi:ATP-dependent helicase/nuclease subunit A
MSDINLKIISAGAGSGKTYRLTLEMTEYINKGVRISGIMATTFTSKAAAELQERVREALLKEGKFMEANELGNALIGTVHGIGVKLLRRFAFEAGVSPEVDIISAEDQQVMFNNALATVLKQKTLHDMERLVTKLGLNKRTKDYDWREKVREITDVARGNDFDSSVLEKSKLLSFASFQALLGEKSGQTSMAIYPTLLAVIEDVVNAILEGGDQTATTNTGVTELKNIKKEISTQGEIPWYSWVKLSKIKVGAKSKKFLEPLLEIIQKHDTFADFHQDIQDFMDTIFDVSAKAIEEYQAYKRVRGLIDYTDMEILVKHLLEQEEVQDVLRDELDLLMVDEFQDTNPIQLAIFFKLSQLAKHAVWVGDPKQSIYGFRGADPKLMKAIVQAQGGVKKENILEHSWRSRHDVVATTNGIFDKAFHDITTEEVELYPKRKENELFGQSLKHWYFELDGEGKQPNQAWFDLCIASTLKKYLIQGEYIETKKDKSIRKIQANDIAILCRTNTQCDNMAKALHQVGIKSAIARKGLLMTAEARLLLACLKCMLDPFDSLSVAEILVLAAEIPTGEIIETRLAYLDELGEKFDDNSWANDNFYIQKIKKLRRDAAEFSSSEMLNLLIEELDLRVVIMTWGKSAQRLDNVDVIRKFALNYEDACKRLNSAASLGGFILWLSDLQANDNDQQSFGEDADAVNILTYHRSKGLEWPVVICHALEGELKDNVFGLSVVSEKEEVDFKDLLGHRWLRFWVNPYADQSKNTALEDRLELSDIQQQVTAATLAEEIRLLYVGITRARDYLIFPSRKGTATSWLNRVWHDGQGDIPSLFPEDQETQWEWKEKVIPLESITYAYDRDFEQEEIPINVFDYFEKRKGKILREPFLINLDNERFSDFFNIKNVLLHTYHTALDITDEIDIFAMNNALQNYLLAHFEKLSGLEKTVLMTNIAKRLNWYQPDFITHIAAYDALALFLKKTFSIQNIKKKLPISYEENGRCFKTEISFLAENKSQIVVLQHDFYNGEKTKQKTNDYGAWAYWTKKSLNAMYPDKEIVFLVHFATLGMVSELKIENII